MAKLLLLFLIAVALMAQPKVPPRFEDFPAQSDWSGPRTAVKLATPSERMFRTKLTDASKEPPDFAGHFRVALWGCGSQCVAGGIVDLETGVVYPPPLGGPGKGWDRWIFASGIGVGPEVPLFEYRRDSRLFLLRRGSATTLGIIDLHYFEWTGTGFRKLVQIPVPMK